MSLVMVGLLAYVAGGDCPVVGTIHPEQMHVNFVVSAGYFVFPPLSCTCSWYTTPLQAWL